MVGVSNNQFTDFLYSNASYDTFPDRTVYTITAVERETIHTAFDALGQAIYSLQTLAYSTESREYTTAINNLQRQLRAIFRIPYKDEETTEDWKFPVIKDINNCLNWGSSGSLPAVSVTIEKTDARQLLLQYQNGFIADTDTITLGFDELSDTKALRIRSCSKGVTFQHAPARPSVFERWKYNPSKLTFSITAEAGEVTLGIRQQPPEKPFWYPTYKRIARKQPYAYATFDKAAQVDIRKQIQIETEMNATTS